jgi:PAS domain S-box-containing protein
MTLVAEEDREWVKEKIAKISAGSPIKIGVHRVINGDGSIGWQEWTDRGIFDENDVLIEFQSVGRDVTEQKLAEEALTESEERFQLLANATFEGIGISDQGKIIDANAQFAEMFGYQQSELIGLQVLELVAPESRELVTKNIKAGFEEPYEHLAATNSPQNEQIERFYDGVLVECNEVAARSYGYKHPEEVIGKKLTDLFGASPRSLDDFYKAFIENGYRTTNAEAREVLDDGTERYFLNNGDGVVEDERLLRVWGTFRDITQIKRAEVELRASEERYRSLIENLPVPLIIHADEEILFVNPATVQIAGLTSPEDYVGQSVWDFIPSDLKDTYAERFEALYKRRTHIDLEESRLVNSDGVELDVEIIATPVEYAGRQAAQTIIRDISDRKRSEEALRQSELRYRTLFENASDGIFLLKDGRVVDCSPSAQELFGALRDEIIGRSLYEFSPPLQLDGRNSREKGEKFIELAMQGEPQRFEWLHKQLDKSLIIVEVYLYRIKIEDENLLLAILRDLTERKRAEEATREERQRLARDLHDAVSQTLWSSTLIADVLPEIWEQDVDKGRERLERLRQLTHGALAEMRALLIELRPATLVESSLEELLQSLSAAAASRTRAQVNLTFKGECLLPQDVHLATYRIAQEALNNAIRHSSPNNIEIKLRCEANNVKLEVSDDGRGFDPKNLPSGTHLGIDIMHERAEGVAGTLDIISRPRRGTKIYFTWSGK